jgi:hypothetical protein
MSRLIQFRVFDNWIKNFMIQEYGGFWQSKGYGFTDCSEVLLYGNTRFVIQQSLDMKDKNGRDIYEGDLINFSIHGMTHGPEREDIKNAEVIWDPENACFSFGRFKSTELIEYSFCFGDRIDRNSIEIVGNIFERK